VGWDGDGGREWERSIADEEELSGSTIDGGPALIARVYYINIMCVALWSMEMRLLMCRISEGCAYLAVNMLSARLNHVHHDHAVD
jgi:hypothetical protein